MTGYLPFTHDRAMTTITAMYSLIHKFCGNTKNHPNDGWFKMVIAMNGAFLYYSYLETFYAYYIHTQNNFQDSHP